jgi:hypothetical protein
MKATAPDLKGDWINRQDTKVAKTHHQKSLCLSLKAYHSTLLTFRFLGGLGASAVSFR